MMIFCFNHKIYVYFYRQRKGHASKGLHVCWRWWQWQRRRQLVNERARHSIYACFTCVNALCVALKTNALFYFILTVQKMKYQMSRFSHSPRLFPSAHFRVFVSVFLSVILPCFLYRHRKNANQTVGCTQIYMKNFSIISALRLTVAVQCCCRRRRHRHCHNSHGFNVFCLCFVVLFICLPFIFMALSFVAHSTDRTLYILWPQYFISISTAYKSVQNKVEYFMRL